MKEESFDLIFMDENIPKLNGLEAVKRIRTLQPSPIYEGIPIIAVTAIALKEDEVKFLNAGMNGYVSKPYEEHDIIHALQTFLP